MSTYTDNELINMLLTLLDENLNVEEKKGLLERKHGIPMTMELSQEVAKMCNLSEYYEEKAVRKDRIERIQVMLKKDCTKEFILSIGYTEEEFSEAEKQMMQLA